MKYRGIEYVGLGRTTAPCRYCDKHSAECHAKYEAYLEFEKIHAKERQEIHKKKHKYNLGFGARWRSEKELAQENVARRQRKAKVFRQTMK